MNVMQGFPVAMDLLHQDFPISMSAQLQDSARLQDAPAMTELESTLEQFRTTVETACGAAASLFLILPGESGHTPPLVTLTADTQLGRQLYEAAMAAVGSLRQRSPCALQKALIVPAAFRGFPFQKSISTSFIPRQRAGSRHFRSFRHGRTRQSRATIRPAR